MFIILSLGVLLSLDAKKSSWFWANQIKTHISYKLTRIYSSTKESIVLFDYSCGWLLLLGIVLGGLGYSSLVLGRSNWIGSTGWGGSRGPSGVDLPTLTHHTLIGTKVTLPAIRGPLDLILAAWHDDGWKVAWPLFSSFWFFSHTVAIFQASMDLCTPLESSAQELSFEPKFCLKSPK